MEKTNTYILPSFLAGFTVALLYHPYDKALYKYSTGNHPFLDRRNFQRPFQGLDQAIIHRMFSTASYYYIQQQVFRSLVPCLKNDCKLKHENAYFIAGMLVGGIQGIISTPVYAIKYQTWNSEHNSFSRAVKTMARSGHASSAFSKGLAPTIYRDMIFGCVYEYIRKYIMVLESAKNIAEASRKDETSLKIFANTLGAGVATILSSPLNYARNHQFAAPGSNTPSTTQVFSWLYNECRQRQGFVNRAGFMQQRLSLGWGTVRGATSMALGQYIIDRCITQIEKKSLKPQ